MIPFPFGSKQAKLIFCYRHTSKNCKERNKGVINTKSAADDLGGEGDGTAGGTGRCDTCWSTAFLQPDREFTHHYYSPFFICAVNMLTNFIINTKTASHLSRLSGEKVKPDERGLQQDGVRSWTEEHPDGGQPGALCGFKCFL